MESVKAFERVLVELYREKQKKKAYLPDQVRRIKVIL